MMTEGIGDVSKDAYSTLETDTASYTELLLTPDASVKPTEALQVHIAEQLSVYRTIN